MNGNMGDDGDDIIRGLDGNDLLNGNSGRDFVNGNQGDDHVLGGEGDDTVAGGQGSDCVRGDMGNDVVIGVGGSDFLSGGDGDDELQPGAPNCREPQSGKIGNWCAAEAATGFENGERCTTSEIATCSEDWVSGDAGNDRIIVLDGIGKVVIMPDPSGSNVLQCKFSSHLKVSNEGTDKFI